MKSKFLVLMVGVLLLAIGGTFWARAQNQAARNGAAQSPKLLVLRGGLLIDGNGGAPLANAVVVISGDKIQSVGPEGSVTIPAGATVIDTSGKTIIPGLVESHTHNRNFEMSSWLYWGNTSIGDYGDQQGWLREYRDAIEKGRIIGPHIMFAGAKFNAPEKEGEGYASGDTISFSTVPFTNEAAMHFLQGNNSRRIVWDQASAEKAVAVAKAEGSDGIKEYSRMPPALMKITADAAHRQGLPVFAHYTSADTSEGIITGTDEILDTGIDVHAHLFGLIKATAPKELVQRIENGEHLVNQAWAQLDTSKYPPMIQKMVAAHMYLNPTLHSSFEKVSACREGIDRLNTAYVNGPIVAGLPEIRRARFAAGFKPAKGGNQAQLAEGYRRAGLFVKEFADAGGKVVAGTSAGGGGLDTPGLALHLEMCMLHEVGLSPMQVLQAATKWSMESWYKDKEVGTVEPGKRADILVLNRNPLDDITATADIYKIIWSGGVVDREGLAHWQDTIPKPELVEDELPNPLLHVPFIDDMSPELVTEDRKYGSELTITGEGFSNEALVLLNNKLISPKVMLGSVAVDPDGKTVKEDQLRITIPSDLMKKPGLYTVVVVQPGSAGGVSNANYLIVEAP